MLFAEFAQVVARHFTEMATTGLYRVAIGADEKAVAHKGQHVPSLLWTTYLSSFPEGGNPLYRQRTEHDCSACRQSIRDIGGLVTIRKNTLVSLWDVAVPWPYTAVAEGMSALVHTAAQRQGIANVFRATTSRLGTASTLQLLPSGQVKSWTHFAIDVPREYRVVNEQLAAQFGEARTTHDVFVRGLTELSRDAMDTVLDLIGRNTLYRGAEQQGNVQAFRDLKDIFDSMKTPYSRELFAWSHMEQYPLSVTRLRNTALGTLLVDVSEGVNLEHAVRAYEAKVAPHNYQRPIALVTRGAIDNAQAEVARLGLTSALKRRYAVMEDITVNNVLWADRSAKQAMGIFEQLKAKAPEKPPAIDRIEEVTIEQFIAEILPQTTALEAYVENRHAGNFVSLIAPEDPHAQRLRLFQWDNGFSWTYHGDLADSIKERVKHAGGNVTADFRASLSWGNYDDLDLHLKEPGGFHIYFGQGKRPESSPYGGQLDVDMNAGRGATRAPVENIVYPRREKMPEGEYLLAVHNYEKREDLDGGFDAEIEFDGSLYCFSYTTPVRHNATIRIARWHYRHTEGLTMLEALPEAGTSKTIWGIPSQTYRTVNIVMLSPNYWDGQHRGNKHWFFMLEGCQREGAARGFFNEYLRPELRTHRKTLELVGGHMRTDEAHRQLSGLGFSSTVRNSLLCKVQGRNPRLVKIMF